MEDTTMRPEAPAEGKPSYYEPTLPTERVAEPEQEVVPEPEKEPDPPFVKRDFTYEHMAFIRSLQEPNMQSRTAVIRSIHDQMKSIMEQLRETEESPETADYRRNLRDTWQMMDDAQNLLGVMSDKEYELYDFSVDIDEPNTY